MARKMRVYAFTRRQPAPPGYVGFEEVSYQQLQERRWWGWKTIDEEIIPSDVRISLACFGDRGSEWKSKFCRIGTFGRDGKFTPRQSAMT